MPVGSEALIAGAYTASFGGSALGLFEGDAGLPVMEHSMVAEDVGNTSLYGKTVIDSLQQGGNVFFAFTCLEAYLSAVKSAFWPYHSTLGRLPAAMGALLYDSSAALVLTAVAGTPAATSPATVTSSKCILAPGFNTRWVFGPTLRKVPIRLRAYPYSSGGNSCWWTVT